MRTPVVSPDDTDAGDGDFAPLVQDLQELGVRVNITAFSDSLSYLLLDRADHISLLDRMPLIRMHPKIQEAA